MVRVFDDVLDLNKNTFVSTTILGVLYILLPILIQGNLKKALAMTDKPMKVNSECQQYRKSRTGQLQIVLFCIWMRESTGIDKVEDSVDLLLVQEVDGENVNFAKVYITNKGFETTNSR